jgi:ABC-type uncharacterized transport system ATPase subunit
LKKNGTRARRHLIPYLADPSLDVVVKAKMSGFLTSEMKRQTRRRTIVVGVHGASAVTALPTDDLPMDLVKHQLSDSTEQWLDAQETNGRNCASRMLHSPGVKSVFDADAESHVRRRMEGAGQLL